MASLYPDEYLAVIQTLVRARKGAGITQQQLAAKLGQRQTFVSKVELGERRLDIVEFFQIGRVIGIDPVELLRTIDGHMVKASRQD